MINIVIAILIQLGIINAPSNFNDLTPTQQEQYIKKIIEDDIHGI